MASQEDYLDNLLKGMTHNEANSPVVESVQPKEEQEQEPEISIPEQEAEPEISVPEYEAEPEISMPEYEAEPEISVPEYEAEPEISVPEYEAEPEISVPEQEAEPEISMPEYEAEPEISVPEQEAEPEISVPEYEAGPEISVPEYEAEPEISVPEQEAEPEISEPEQEAEPEVSVPDAESESISEEIVLPQEEFLDAEENGIADIAESETFDAEESEIPGTEESEVPGIEENVIPNMESEADSEISLAEYEPEPEPEESEISNLEELFVNMDENISDMEEKDVPDLDTVMGMSEDEIAQMLSEGGAEAITEAADVPEQDVLDMLEGAVDDDLQDIQDMLQKSDNNEAVDDEIVELLQGVPGDEEDLEEKILSEDGSLTGNSAGELDELLEDPKKKKALEKKRQKEEKAAAKKAAREAAKAQKAAKKRAKQAKKKRKNKDVQDIPIENINGEELLFDRDELDKLVSKAGQVGHEESEIEDNEDEQGGSLELDLNSLLTDGGDSGETGLDDLAETETDVLSASDDLEADDQKKKIKAAKKEKAEKTGFLAKILSFLMDEDDEEDEEKEKLRLSEENQGILNDLDKEGKSVKGGKGGTGGKKKKDNKKDSKKDKPKKEEKPKKAPKPKKEKPPKEPEPYVPPRKRLTLKKVLPVGLLGITVLVAILIFVNVCTDYVDKRAAKTAYYNGDYVTCYQNLVGKELNETEAVMYGKSESILYIRLWYREYEMFVEEGAEVEALDSLIQTVKDYPMLYEYASKWNAEGEVYSVYADILNILLNKYGITELQAKEIAKERDDIEYTRMVVALTEGKPYGSWDNTGASGQSGADSSLPHELPEEFDLGQGNFVDNR